MAKKAVTLYIDDTSIRLMVTSGQRVKKWADVPLEPGLVKNSVVQKPEEVAAKIRQLFKVHKINSKKVILGISGLHCLTRPILLPQLPKDMLEEAVRREAKRVLPVSPEQLYLSWKSLPATEGKARVFLAAMPQNVADALVNTLQLAGLKPDLMDTKPILLARLVKDMTAIIVDVQPTEFDIIIKADGIPHPVRTVSFPDEKISSQDKLSMIQNEINRTIDFYNTDNKQFPLTPALPVFVSGELADAASQSQALSHKLDRPVIPMPPPFENPDGLNPNRYMANMGLVLKKILPLNGSSLLLSNLNLLPKVYQPEPISLIRITAVPGFISAVAFLLLLTLTIRSTLADASDIRSQLNNTTQLLQQKFTERQQLIDTIGKSEQEMKNIEVFRGNIAAALANFERQSQKMNGDLAVTINTMPDTVSLTQINHTDTSFTLTGLATSEEEALSYLSELKASGRFTRIKIANMSRIEDQEVQFNVVLHIGN
ncbi:MAG: pilus assembly protein PilM [Chloroflexota bacterium]|nr:pilus assembly protein PilM [Chloroflexota bacterium]